MSLLFVSIFLDLELPFEPEIFDVICFLATLGKEILHIILHMFDYIVIIW